MGAKNARGIWVPGAGDGLLEAWATMAAELGVWIPVDSVSAAAEVLTTAQAAGMGASSSTPLLFLIGSGPRKVAYTADGSKTGGKWNLAPLNEQDAVEQTYTLGVSATVGNGKFSPMITSTLSAAPYDRSVQAWGTAYGSVSGNVDLCLRILGGDDVLSRFSSGDAQSQSVTNYGIIPANTSPGISLGVKGGGPSGGTVTLSKDGRLNRLIVNAAPISMSA